jgi:hypothetical protein
LIGLSNGEHFIVKDENDLLMFLRQQKNQNFLAYNADYDAQSMLVWLPKKELDYLMKGIEIEYEGVKFLYYRRKFLKCNTNWLFDVYQYYHAGTLDAAAQKYLGKKKLSVETKIFTEKTIYDPKTIKYCINDAKLAYELFMKMYRTLPKELLETKPISTAYYSAKYFRKELSSNRIPVAVNEMARQAYHGGLFTINTKGHFYNLFNYDIVSAYPFEICNLRGMQYLNVVNHKGYVKDAAYGFYHVKVDITDKYVSPLIYKYKGLCLNPVGKYEGIITKKEFEVIQQYDPEIVSGYHIFCNDYTPFRKRMEQVFYRKCNDENKIVWKYLANSLYGKTASALKVYRDKDLVLDDSLFEVIERDGRYYYKVEDIEKSNFIYASEITANTRLRMYNEIYKHKENIIAVQTDSLVSKISLNLEVDPNKLGAWKLEKWDEAYMIGSGVYFYRIGKEWHGKFRGFNFSGAKVEDILERLLTSDKPFVDFDILKRISIQESKRTHNEDMANAIVNTTRKLNINFDRKRIWLGKWKSGKELETKVIRSLAVFLKSFTGQDKDQGLLF